MALSIETRGTAGIARLENLAPPSESKPTLKVPMGPHRATKSEPGLRSFSTIFGFLKPALSAVLLGAMLAGGPVSAQTNDQNTSAPQRIELNVSAPLKSGALKLLALDANHDGKVVKSRFGDEIGAGDSLSKAIFAYVDFVNPRGDQSLWGPATLGDYQEGGLGLGFTMRPRHMTGNGILLENDITSGVRMLDKAMGAPKGNDLVTADLNAVLATLDGTEAQRLDAVSNAAEKLLQHIQKETEKKELATNNTVAVLTDAELLASLPAGSLERAIAETTASHGATFFASQIELIAERAHALHLPPRAEKGVAGEAQQHYILVLAKRATEARLIGEVKAALPAQ
ncbi:MAG: hypothetical protein U1E65_01090 [Myxococcota bacterium]